MNGASCRLFPLNQVYLKTPDLIQWVSEVLPSVFTYDFVSYSKQLQDAGQYFTANGWKKFLDQVNVYANYDNIQTSKQFVSAGADGAPFVINQGLLNDRYAWWVQIPLNIRYITVNRSASQPLVVQVLVVRVSTLNNLYGVGIDNIVVTKGGGNQVHVNANG